MKRIWSAIKRFAGPRFLFLAGAYTAIFVVSLWLGYLLRFDFTLSPAYREEMLVAFLWIIPLKLLLLFFFRQFAGLLSYFSTPDLWRIFCALAIASTVIAILWWIPAIDMVPPRSVIMADFLFSFMGVAALRLAFRIARERYGNGTQSRGGSARPVAIIGAGNVGANLARELRIKSGLGLNPVAFLDDDPRKWNSRIYDIPVLGAPESLEDLEFRSRFEEVILAIPNATSQRMGEIVKLLQRTRLKFETVPSIFQLVTGKVRVSQLRPVEIQDLLGRDSVELETENIKQIIEGKVVLVTGAGGSIGSELCRQIVRYHPKRLLMVDQSEVQLFPIEQELAEEGFGGVVLPLVANVTDIQRLRFLFGRYLPTLVFHAAAHKHVPMMESQPCQAMHNNVLGTVNVARLALEYQAERFVQVSTDKAINPTNVMGASKRLAEIFLGALYSAHPNGTKFMAVRFGNVLGSSGSVIPTFKKQIEAGGPIRVTHPEVTRFFMTIPEAVGLVLQSGAQGTGGEIFILDMGEPVKIVDLARQLIELSGLQPEVDIEIEFIGLRPGEKLYEELSHKSENIIATAHPKILRLVCQAEPLDTVERMVDEITSHLQTAEPNKLKLMIKKFVPEYAPYMN